MQVDFKTGTFYLGDCFDVMATLEAGSVDMVLNDPPYGTTQNKWDAVIPFEPMWAAYWRLLKSNGAAVLTAAQPFTSALVMSQVGRFKYSWHWDKVNGIRNHLNAKHQPMRQMEDVCVFAREKSFYAPQMREGGYVSRKTRPGQSEGFGKVRGIDNGRVVEQLYPTDLLSIPSHDPNRNWHPTQKPVALFAYLIRTYTNPGDLVLDNTAGSGTTAIAALQAGRRWVCIERDPEYFAKAIARVYDAEAAL